MVLRMSAESLQTAKFSYGSNLQSFHHKEDAPKHNISTATLNASYWALAPRSHQIQIPASAAELSRRFDPMERPSAAVHPSAPSDLGSIVQRVPESHSRKIENPVYIKNTFLEADGISSLTTDAEATYRIRTESCDAVLEGSKRHQLSLVPPETVHEVHDDEYEESPEGLSRENSSNENSNYISSSSTIDPETQFPDHLSEKLCTPFPSRTEELHGDVVQERKLAARSTGTAVSTNFLDTGPRSPVEGGEPPARLSPCLLYSLCAVEPPQDRSPGFMKMDSSPTSLAVAIAGLPARAKLVNGELPLPELLDPPFTTELFTFNSYPRYPKQNHRRIRKVLPYSHDNASSDASFTTQSPLPGSYPQPYHNSPYSAYSFPDFNVQQHPVFGSPAHAMVMHSNERPQSLQRKSQRRRKRNGGNRRLRHNPMRSGCCPSGAFYPLQKSIVAKGTLESEESEDGPPHLDYLKSGSSRDGGGEIFSFPQHTTPYSGSSSGCSLSSFELTTMSAAAGACPKGVPDEGANAMTTIMLRNIPNKYTQQMLLDVVNQQFCGLYDFFYLPIDFRNRCNVGYAFINFIHFHYAVMFKEQFDGVKLGAFKSNKVCEVSWGRVQGLEANVEHCRNSAVMAIPIAQYRPMVFKNGVIVPFPSADGPLPEVKLRPQKF